MAHAVNYNLVLGRVVEDKVRIGRDDYAPETVFARKLTGARVLQQKIDGELSAYRHVTGTLRRSRLDVVNTWSSSAAPRRV